MPAAAGGGSVRQQAAQRAVPAYRPPGVERGATGKEREYQQNRQFGPGPIKPYPGPGYSGQNPYKGQQGRESGNGVYRGGARTRPIPPARGQNRGAFGGRPGVTNA